MTIKRYRGRRASCTRASAPSTSRALYGLRQAQYNKGALKIGGFGKLRGREGPNAGRGRTASPCAGFKPDYDFEVGHSTCGGKHLLTYGGNARRNNFDITLAPNSKNVGVRRVLPGGVLRRPVAALRRRRVDKFATLKDACLPRVSLMYKR